MPDAVKLDFDPNARFDTGPNAAGCGRASTQDVLDDGGSRIGLSTDGVLYSAHLRVGLNAAGVSRNNPGPNVAGATRSYNAT